MRWHSGSVLCKELGECLKMWYQIFDFFFFLLVCLHELLEQFHHTLICCHHFYICSWFTLDVSISSSNMSLMLSSETMSPPSRLPCFQIIILPHHTVVPLLLRVDLLKIGLTRCPHIVCVLFFSTSISFILSKKSTWVYLVHRLCDILWVTLVGSNFFKLLLLLV